MEADGATQEGFDSLNQRIEAVQQWDKTLCDWSQ